MLYQLSYSPKGVAKRRVLYQISSRLCGGFCYNTRIVKYKYLYQDRANVSHAGEIAARDRAEAYAKLRKQGIRPYRVIGDDPWNWRPWAISAGYVILSVALVVLGVISLSQARQLRELQMADIEESEY